MVRNYCIEIFRVNALDVKTHRALRAKYIQDTFLVHLLLMYSVLEYFQNMETETNKNRIRQKVELTSQYVCILNSSAE